MSCTSVPTINIIHNTLFTLGSMASTIGMCLLLQVYFHQSVVCCPNKLTFWSWVIRLKTKKVLIILNGKVQAMKFPHRCRIGKLEYWFWGMLLSFPWDTSMCSWIPLSLQSCSTPLYWKTSWVQFMISLRPSLFVLKSKTIIQVE